MALEIEHKYLVSDDGYRSMSVASVRIRQGYLSRTPGSVVRVRIAGDRGFLTVKGRNYGSTETDSRQAVRNEFEYAVPLTDARQMLEMCGDNLIDKTRYIVPFAEHTWEVDVFHGRHEGLTVAEVELKDADEDYALPPFVGRNVTGDPRYYNSNM